MAVRPAPPELPVPLPLTEAREPAVRDALHACLAASLRGEWEIINEFWIPLSHERADVVVVGDGLQAFEIETARDTLKRLERQAEAYGRVFDRCTAVVADRHLRTVVDSLPEWWGIRLIDAAGTFPVVRDSCDNPATDALVLVRLLWREDVHAALQELGATVPPGAGRSHMWSQLLDLVSETDVRYLVRQALLTRDGSDARIPTRRFASLMATEQAAS